MNTLLIKYIDLSNYWGERTLFEENGKITMPYTYKHKEAVKKEKEYTSIVLALLDKLGKDNYARQID